MTKRISLIFSVLLVALTGCNHHQYFVDFSTPDSTHQGMHFMPTLVQYSTVDKRLPENCYLMGGLPVDEVMAEDAKISADAHRTTSLTSASLLQNLLQVGNQSELVQLAGVYQSEGADGQPILLSGKVILPADGRFRRYILVSHYTIGANREAPSNCFSLEGVLAKMGYAVILPDYEGYGISRERIHPYLMMELTAKQVVDMFHAVRAYMDAKGLHPQYEDVYLMGYSQGGATTMAVERYIETHASSEGQAIRVRRVFAGGGPYDVQATYDRFVTTDVASYPVAVPLVLQGMIYGAKLKITCEEMMNQRVCRNMDKWVNSKDFSTAQINEALGTRVTHELLSDVSMDRTSPQVAELYKAMAENSILYYSWTPAAPVYMMHSIDDETVPYENATLAKDKWHKANIQYNFGHYGSHVKTCLRFIYTVQTLLEEEEKEQR